MNNARPLLLALLGLAVAACKEDDRPDARLALPPPIDAGLTAADARTFDGGGGGVDAPPAIDARVADAAIQLDAAAPPPDAAPPDAPLPTGPASVILNELSPDFTDGHDLVELLVTESGTTDGIKLERDHPGTTTVLATLPDVIVFAGDIIVVHLMPAGTSAAAETLAVDEKPTLHNFDGAWDFLGGAEQIPYSNVILSLRAKSGTVTSAVPFFRADLTEVDDSFPRLFPEDLQAIITEGLWAETCDPAPCKYTSNLAEVTVSWLGAGTSNDPDSSSGASVARKTAGHDQDKVSDWKSIPAAAPFNSYGAPN
jgi:hypothetical protein